MRSLFSVCLALLLCICSVIPIAAQDVTYLTNQDIVMLVKAKLPSPLIIEKINTSSCRFDTFPSVLAELKYKGIPDDVLMAMVRAPHGGPRLERVPPAATPTSVGERNEAPPPIVTDVSTDRTSETSLPVSVSTSSPIESKRPENRSGQTRKHLEEIKIRGYITELQSPKLFEIEDYRITRDESVVLEFENENSEVTFNKDDLRIGTLVEIRGLYDESTNELRATKIKIDLDQFRQLDVTTILDRKPVGLQQTEYGWRGLIAADGRRVRIEPETKMLFNPNRTKKSI